MALETFEAGYAGTPPVRTGKRWAGVWRLQQLVDRIINDRWPQAGNIVGAESDAKSFSTASQATTARGLFINEDETRAYVCDPGTLYQYQYEIPGNLNTLFYTNKSFVLTGQEIANSGVYFKSDGTKFYTIGTNSDRVHQYSCSTAWDISTAVYDNIFLVTTQDAVPNDIWFKPDGTRFYIAGDGTDKIHQYSCSTAWDISTATYSGSTALLSTLVSGLAGVCLDSTGTELTIMNSGTTALFFTLTTPWDVSTATFAAQNHGVDAQIPGGTASSRALFVKPDGSGFYVAENSTDKIHQYAMTSPVTWDISRNVAFEKDFYVGTQSTEPNGISFKDDGTKFYVVDGSGTVYQYSCSTAWDLATASYDSILFSVSAQESAVRDVWFKPDGTKFFIVGELTDAVYQYSCSTAWDISTASYDSKSLSIAAQDSTSRGITFSNDGTKFFIAGTGNDRIYEYTCSTAWDISTGTYTNYFYSTSSITNDPQGIWLNSTGEHFYVLGSTNSSGAADNRVYHLEQPRQPNTLKGLYYNSATVVTSETASRAVNVNPSNTKLFIIGETSDRIFQYDKLSASFIDFSYDYGLNIAAQEGQAQSIVFKPDGTKFYIVGFAQDFIHQYTCSTAWDLTTAYYDNVRFSVASQEGTPAGLSFKPDGTAFYMVGTSSDTVFQYSCSTAWDISTASYASKSALVSATGGTPRGLVFKPDGTFFYLVDSSGNTVNQWSCSTAWDISTAEPAATLLIRNEITSPVGLCFNSSGTKFYVVTSLTSGTIVEYKMSTPWYIVNAEPTGATFSVATQETNCRGLFLKPDDSVLYIVGENSDRVFSYQLV